SRGMASQDELMRGYFPMRPKVAYNEDAFERTTLGTSSSPQGGVGATGIRYRALNTNEKVFRSPDEVLAADAALGGGLLSKAFDPADEFLAHLNRVSGNIALDNFVKELTKIPNAATPVTVFGLQGKPAMEQGLRVAQREARAEAGGRAVTDIARRFRIPEVEVRSLLR